MKTETITVLEPTGGEWMAFIFNYMYLIKDNAWLVCACASKTSAVPSPSKRPPHPRKHSAAASLLDRLQSPSGILAGISSSLPSMWPRPWQAETKAPQRCQHHTEQLQIWQHQRTVGRWTQLPGYSPFVCSSLSLNMMKRLFKRISSVSTSFHFTSK